MKIGDRVQRQEGKTLKKGTIAKVNKNQVCCKNTDNEHFHDIVYDVIWDNENNLSRGYLPHGLTNVNDCL